METIIEAAEEAASEAAVAAAVLIAAQEKCIKQFAQIAEKNAKFLSSQQKASQFIAEIVIRTTKSFETVLI